MNDDIADDLLHLLGQLDERIRVLEARPPVAGWARSLDWLLQRWVTRRNAMTVAATLVAIYMTYFAANVVNAPLT